MAKSRVVITRARLGRAGRHAFTGLSDGRLTPKTACEDSKLELNHSYLDEPEVTIIHRMDQPGVDEPRIYAGDLLIADRRVKPDDGSLVIAMIDGEMVVRHFLVSHGNEFLCAGGDSGELIEVTDHSQAGILATIVSVIPVIREQ